MISNIIQLVCVTGLVGWFYFHHRKSDLRKFIIPGITLKVLGALSLGYIYMAYLGGGDTLQYHRAALIWRELCIEDPMAYLKALLLMDDSLSRLFIDQPRAVFFTKIVSLIEIISFGNYWISALYFALLSFIGSWFLLNQLASKFGGAGWWFGVLFLFPSLLFWASGIMKETVSFAILAYLAGIVIKYFNESGKVNYFELIISLLLVWVLVKVKYYVAGVFIPVIVGILLIRYLTQQSEKLMKSNALKYGLLAGVLVVFFLVATTINHNLSLGNILDRMVMTHNILYQGSPENFRINYVELKPDGISFLRNAPNALLAGLYRPFVWEGEGWMVKLAGMENLILLLLCLAATFFSWKLKLKPTILGVGILVYVLTMATCLALSTPNFGTLVRFKTAFSPFLLVLCIYCVREWRITSVRLQK